MLRQRFPRGARSSLGTLRCAPLVDSTAHRGMIWKELFRRPGFPFLFSGMFISLFGTGMNYAGVTWYVKAQTHSDVMVGLLVTIVTLPGLVVPLLGGVLIDRVDRRYLGIALDVTRGILVLGVAALAWSGRLALWQLYAMVFVLGAGFGVYWSTTNALLQELMMEQQGAQIPLRRLVGANSAVLIAIQGGMMSAGALVGFVYDRAGLQGILGIDGTTYLISAMCLVLLRRGHFPPHRALGGPPPQATPGIEAPAEMTEPAQVNGLGEPEPLSEMIADLREGFHYLREQPRVLALGVTYSCMMAGVVSSNVVLVALAADLLRAGPGGFGWIEFGWAAGAVSGGLAAGAITRRHPEVALIVALVLLAIGHALFPYALLLWVVVAMNAALGACRAVAGVITQSAVMNTVPRKLMGRTQSAFSMITTLIQIAMSFSLGGLASHFGLPIAFFVLGLIYCVAVATAMRARSLGHFAPEPTA
jgi:DHA3 family macrolide efflux protein-like MFS transporter